MFEPALDRGQPVAVVAAGTALLSVVKGKPVVRVKLTILPEAVAAQQEVVDPQRVFDSQPAVGYPAQALRQGLTGRIRYRVTVDSNGEAQDSRIVLRSPIDRYDFDDAVLEFARKSRYVAGWRDGGPAAGVCEGECVFELQH
jgi:TonB family protein